MRPGLGSDLGADAEVPEAIGIERVGENDLSGGDEGEERQKEAEAEGGGGLGRCGIGHYVSNVGKQAGKPEIRNSNDESNSKSE